MVYDLAQDQHIPVGWAINPNKAIYGADFTPRGKSYSGGPFILEAPSAAARSTVARWQAQGVVVNKINTAFVAPVYNSITSFPRTVLDLANGKTTVACSNAARSQVGFAPPASGGYVDFAGGVAGAPAAVPRTPRLGACPGMTSRLF
jgi:hypothetical protein